VLSAKCLVLRTTLSDYFCAERVGNEQKLRQRRREWKIQVRR